MNTETRRDLCNMTVTLDGKPAAIVGIYNDFATVRRLDVLSAEYAFCWETVARIVAKDGAFKS